MTPAHATGTVERIFALEPAPIAVPDQPGVLLLHAHANVAVDDGLTAVHHPGIAVGAALAELTAPGPAAATLTSATATVEGVWLALRFALHLAEHRRGGPAPGPCLTSTAQPTPLPDEVIAVPHLVAVTENGHTRDRAVWEVMPAARASAWLGGRPLPDPAWCTGHLPALLSLRRQLRDGRLTRPAYAPLLEALRGRYLSILFTLTHPDLITSALAGPACEPAP